MAYNHEYPYVDPNRYNADWILNKIKELEGEMDTFEALNKITFDGEWDITKQYPAWCIVNTNGGQEGYISLKPVPAGVTIDNAEYWTSIVNYTATIADLQNRVIALENKDNYVTPQMYGAVADGVTDDTAAVKEALADSKCVHFPAGVYLISETLEPQSGSSLIGYGANDSILKAAPGMNANMIEYVGSSEGVQIEKLKITFDGSGSTSGSCIVLGDGVPDSSNGNGTFIHDVVLYHAPEDGLIVNGYYWTCVFDGIFAEKCGGAGIRVNGSDNIYSNINVFNCRYGMYVQGSNNKICNAKLYVCGQDYYDAGLGIVSAGLYMKTCYRNQLINVEAQDCMNYGFWLSGCDTIEIKNCLSDANANINTYIPGYEVANNYFDSCKNMRIDMANDDYTTNRCKHIYEMVNCKDVTLTGTVARSDAPGIMTGCTGCIDSTHYCEVLDTMLTRGYAKNLVSGIGTMNGNYSDHVYTPTTSGINNNGLKILLDDLDEDCTVTFAAIMNLPAFTYTRVRFYSNGSLLQDEASAIHSAGDVPYLRTCAYSAGSTNNFVIINCEAIQAYTVKGIAALSGVPAFDGIGTNLLINNLINVADRK